MEQVVQCLPEAYRLIKEMNLSGDAEMDYRVLHGSRCGRDAFFSADCSLQMRQDRERRWTETTPRTFLTAAVTLLN